jgi:hypothetical protein
VKEVFTGETQRSLRDAELGLIIESMGFLFNYIVFLCAPQRPLRLSGEIF